MPDFAHARTRAELCAPPNVPPTHQNKTKGEGVRQESCIMMNDRGFRLCAGQEQSVFLSVQTEEKEISKKYEVIYIDYIYKFIYIYTRYIFLVSKRRESREKLTGNKRKRKRKENSTISRLAPAPRLVFFLRLLGSSRVRRFLDRSLSRTVVEARNDSFLLLFLKRGGPKNVVTPSGRFVESGGVASPVGRTSIN